MTKKLFLAVILMLSFVVVGCSSNSTTKSPDNNTESTTVEKSQNNTNTSEETKPKEETKKTEVPEKKINKVKLAIYSEDANTMELKEISNIEIDETLSLENKLKQLANALSSKTFDKLPIDLKSIDNINGKKIATINLKDNNNSKWASKFQGSTGGQITSDSLYETFLQIKYKGEWIDGVKFLYNDQPIEYEHVSDLSQIKYRFNNKN